MVAILTRVTPQAAVALGNLRRRGFAVTAILNMYEDRDYAEAAGVAMAERIEGLHLKDEESLSSVCRRYVLR